MIEIDFKKFKNRIINNQKISPKIGVYEEFPNDLDEELKKYLKFIGISKLYEHQAEMFSKSQNGENIIITTSTASGKTLSFILPVINKILKEPLTRALFIYPTKALTSDQFRNIIPIIEYFGKNKINAGIYDGDTPSNERSRIRKEANIILTNPEMLNSAFLPYHSKYDFNYIFKNLDYIIIDELHYYRGAFGSHIANVIRRLKRITKYYNSKPQFFCSTATIANPLELAEEIFGEKFSIVDKDGSPSGEKEIFFWVPPLIEKKLYRISTETEASDLIPEMIVQNYKFIAFSQSRRVLEVILKEVREKLSFEEGKKSKNRNLSNLISGYRGGYKAEERKEIERKMVNNEIKGVVATNALELGIDIGDIDLVISIGFPKTKASFFQQIGRAGRKGNKSYSIIILDMNKTYDQYISLNPEWIFNSKIENAIIDKDNLFIQIAHLRAAAAELPLSLDDISLFPDLGEILPILIKNKEIIKSNGKFIWSGKEFPAGDYSLRTISEIRYKVINKKNNEVLTEMEEFTAYREVHKNAIYIHDGEMYLVENLDIDNRIAEVIPVNYNYYTVPWINTNIKVINEIEYRDYNNTKKSFGDIMVSTQISQFKKMQFHNHQNLGTENIGCTFEKNIETEGVWLKIPEKVRIYFDEKNIQFKENDLSLVYYNAISNLTKNSFMIRTMTSDNDIDNGIFIDSDKNISICIYDSYIGGLGFSEKGYELIEEILEAAYEIVSKCNCKNGCPACVGSYKIDKKVISWAVKSFFESEDEPTNMELIEFEKIENIEQKLFNIIEIEEKWDKFKELLSENFPGAYLSSFIQTIKKVIFSNNDLILITDKYIEEELFMTLENISTIKGLIDKYFFSEVIYNIKITNSIKTENIKKEKIERRYYELKK